MTHTSFRFIVALLALSVAACSSSSRERVAGVGQRVGSQDPGYAGFHGHIMPPVNKKAPKNAAATAATGTLQYYGGKIIPNAKIYSVYWGSPGSYQPQLDQFLQTVPPGPYMAWLGEYDTPTQNLGPGSFGGSYVDTTAPSGTTIDDSQIQSELLSLVAAGSLPAPDGDTLYLFFFAQGVNITAFGSESCSSFCGYHDTLVSGSQELYYGVLPDPATCGSGCDNQSGNYFADLTSVTTHEITEAVTDPEVGIAIQDSEQDGGTYPTFPNGWTSASGEIGDLCAWQNATVDGYNVQLEWSNAQGGCIAPGATTGDDGGSGEGGDDGGADATTNAFSITLSTTSLSIAAGTSASVTVTTTLASGNSESVALTIAGLPAGVTATFDPTSIASSAGSSTLTLVVDPSASASSSTATVIGTSPSTNASAAVSVTVSAATSEAGASCDHSTCTTGDALDPSCDPCAGQVCAADSYCCTTWWDSICVSEVASYCGATCP